MGGTTLDCRQASLLPALFYSEAALLKGSRMCLHCPVGVSTDVSEKDGWQHMLFQNVYVPLNVNGAVTDVTVTRGH